MKYIRKHNGMMEERPASPYMGTVWYNERGWLPYAGELPLDRLDVGGGVSDENGIVRGGTVVELAAPAATEEWVDKAAFIDAVTALIPDEAKPAVSGDWRTIAWVAQLPGDLVNLLDPRIGEFCDQVELPLEAIRAKMEELSDV